MHFPSRTPTEGSLRCDIVIQRKLCEQQLLFATLCWLLLILFWHIRALYGEYLGWISSKVYLVLPFYIQEGGWEFSYSVTHQNVLRKTYTYEITARQFYWLLLLPFSWINFFTYSLEDAVQSTTAQFVMDAQREGYFGNSELTRITRLGE